MPQERRPLKPKRRAPQGRGGKVALCRALSKLGILSRAQAIEAVHEGRVRVDGRVITDPGARVVPARIQVTVDDEPWRPAAWRTILLHKPRGIMTTRRDPEGRRTVYDVLGDAGQGLIAVGRLDLASSGLLLLTTDTRLAEWIANPENGVSRRYVVTVRGRIGDEDVARLTAGITVESVVLTVQAIEVRKVSSRESHLTVELREGKNREIRRLFAAVDHEVTRLKRIGLGGLALNALEPGQWRDVSREEIASAFPGAPIAVRTTEADARRPPSVQGSRTP